MARQCTQPQRPRNSAWFKENILLLEAQESDFQTDDLDAYDSDYDDVSLAKAILMAHLSSCDSDVLSEEIDTLKQTLSNHVKEKESLSTTLTIFKIESKEKESKYIDKEIVLEKQNKELENILSLGYQNLLYLKKAQRIKPPLYDGSVISKKNDAISVIDDEETLILEEESRSKMLEKQNDQISKEKKINISLIDYSKLNKLFKDFGKCFVPQKELFAEQAFWLTQSNPISEKSVKSHTPKKVEAPSKLPKVSLVNTSLKKIKYHLASFDDVVKKRITPDAITEGAWGFEHTKARFLIEIIPFLKFLKVTFNAFEKTLLDEITEVQTVFNQMEAAVEQCSVDKNSFEIQIKQLRIDNDELLNQIMSQEIMNIAVNSIDIISDSLSCVDKCNKCLELEVGLVKKKDMIEKDVYDELSKRFSTLEKHYISLELSMQLNQQIFQNKQSCENQNALAFPEYYKINELKAQSQAKDAIIRKLKDNIKSLSAKDNVEYVKKDVNTNNV
ncbi:hypothetical protein Tco_1212340 [Tanacetum coccineum]